MINIRLIIHLLFLILVANCLTAQGLLESPRRSSLTYIYKISDKEAFKLYETQLEFVDTTFFHTLIDSFHVDSLYSKELPSGHYLKTHTVENEHKVSIASIAGFDAVILNNDRDLRIQVLDQDGKSIENASVKIRSKRIKFNKKLQSYYLPKSNKKGILIVEVDGIQKFYLLGRQMNNSTFRRTARTIAYESPAKYVWLPINFVLRLPVDVVRSINKGHPVHTVYKTNRFFDRVGNGFLCIFNKSYCRKRYRTNYLDGYIAFDKKIYRRNDTIRLKAFLIDRKDNPLDVPLSLSIKTESKEVVLGEIEPYRPGGFEHSFVLHDSLEVYLDKKYQLFLKSEKGKYYYSTSIYLEDYELKKYKLDVDISNKTHYHNTPFFITMNLRDANDMHVMDARVELKLSWNKIDEYLPDSLFLEKHILDSSFVLNPFGSTKINIDEDHFKPVNGQYQIHAKVTTVENEVLTWSKNIHYFRQNEALEIIDKSDSLIIRNLQNGKSVETLVQVFATDMDENRRMIRQETTPFQLEVVPYFKQYDIVNSDQTMTWMLGRQESELVIQTLRQGKTMVITTQNPRNISFHYQLFKKGKLLQKGYTTDFSYAAKSKINQDYTIAVQYLWAGKTVYENFGAFNEKSELTVQVDQPNQIYPGKEQEIEVTVTDYKGKPTADVDITAYGMNSLFNYTAPTLPHTGKSYYRRKVINNFNIESLDSKGYQNQRLYFEFWKDKFKLDSLEYYHFLFPGGRLFSSEIKTPDESTQFAPFVVNKFGEFIPIHIVYINSKPVYFSWSDLESRYSFLLEPGYHKVKIRTAENEIYLDSVFVQGGFKTVISLQTDSPIRYKRVQKVSNKLSFHERKLLSGYMASFDLSHPSQKNLYMENNGRYYFFDEKKQQYRGYGYLKIGPVGGNMRVFNRKQFMYDFDYQKDYRYKIQENNVLLKFAYDQNLLPDFLTANEYKKNLSDFAWTPQSLELYFEKPVAPRKIVYYKTGYNKAGKGSLLLVFSQLQKDSLQPDNNWIILESLARPYFIRVTPFRDPQIFNLTPDIYRATLLLQDGSYLQSDALEVHPNGTNFYRIKKETFLAKDSLSHQLRQLLEDHTNQSIDHGDVGIEIESSAQLGDYIEIDGYIVEKNIQDPLTGASVATLDGKWGTITDLDGYFRLKVPRLTKELEVAYLGYDTRIIQLYGRKNLVVELSPSSMLLEEVVVTSYKVGLRQQDNVSSFRASTIGVADSKRLSQATIGNIKTNKLSAEKRPLIILDDQVYSGNFEDISPLIIDKVEFLNVDEATKRYGEPGRNGAYIVYTRRDSSQASNYFFDDLESLDSTANRLRTDFRDNAFWQPKLATDKNGKVKFKVTFPDDVTAWSTHYLAMSKNAQRGSFHSKIKSFKPVLAKLDVPRFLISGDTSRVLGRATNYQRDTLNISRYFKVNGKKIELGDNLLATTLNDYNMLVASEDTLVVSYEMSAENGIYDGEQRSIEVHPVGLEEVEGIFELIQNDTIIRIRQDPSKGPLHLNIKSNQIDFILQESKHLTDYKYLCNEQLASKLNGFLNIKKLMEIKEEPFTADDQINKIIKELCNKIGEYGLWGWWEGSSRSIWISQHVLFSLLRAAKAGYDIPADFEKTKEVLALSLDHTKNFNDLKFTMIALKELDVNIPETYYIQKLEELKDSSTIQLLGLLEVKSIYGQPFDPDTLLPLMQKSVLGYAYLRDTAIHKFSIHHHAYAHNILAYWIFRRAGGSYEVWAKRIQNYFLEERKSNNWLNTYFQSQILDIFTDSVNPVKDSQKQIITINGNAIEDFPYYNIDSTGSDMVIEKKGKSPIYLTVYQKYWNSNPTPKQEVFNIQTTLPDTLTAGKIFHMKVTLEVPEEATYVMLNIPIPASCSYAKKLPMQRDWHVEYDRKETNIYMEYLKPGIHTIYIPLLPRFSGSYTLNPAKASLMYFPPVNSNNEMSRVVVK